MGYFFILHMCSLEFMGFGLNMIMSSVEIMDVPHHQNTCYLFRFLMKNSHLQSLTFLSDKFVWSHLYNCTNFNVYIPCLMFNKKLIITYAHDNDYPASAINTTRRFICQNMPWTMEQTFSRRTSYAYIALKKRYAMLASCTS